MAERRETEFSQRAEDQQIRQGIARLCARFGEEYGDQPNHDCALADMRRGYLTERDARAIYELA